MTNEMAISRRTREGKASGGSTTSRRRLPQAAVESICLATLSRTDTIRIHTANSIYSFFITDPKERSGILLGGVFRNRRVTAVLVGAETGTAVWSSLDDTRLALGTRAFFLTGTQEETTKLVTSEILRLTYIKGAPGLACLSGKLSGSEAVK